jgi:GrpB-like predicted nucleotidyltransferase (UPF0157 family)
MVVHAFNPKTKKKKERKKERKETVCAITVVNSRIADHPEQVLMKITFQVSTISGKEAELQRELRDMLQKTTQLSEDYNKEKNRLTEEVEVLREELQNTKVSFP